DVHDGAVPEEVLQRPDQLDLLEAVRRQNRHPESLESSACHVSGVCTTPGKAQGGPGVASVFPTCWIAIDARPPDQSGRAAADTRRRAGTGAARPCVVPCAPPGGGWPGGSHPLAPRGPRPGGDAGDALVDR